MARKPRLAMAYGLFLCAECRCLHMDILDENDDVITTVALDVAAAALLSQQFLTYAKATLADTIGPTEGTA